MKYLLLLGAILSASVVAEDNPSDEAMAALERMNNRINELGDLKGFAHKIGSLIQNNQCKKVAEYMSPKSIYASDKNYFYAKCLYSSRHIGDISKFRIGHRSFEVVNNDGSPPFIPKIPILFSDMPRNYAVHLVLDLSGEHYRLSDMEFMWGEDQQYRPPSVNP